MILKSYKTVSQYEMMKIDFFNSLSRPDPIGPLGEYFLLTGCPLMGDPIGLKKGADSRK